jgi:TRAP-type mannitol/chloroaromatic compound transport system permease small subunit
VFTIPLAWIMIDLAWPYFMRAYESGEMSQNAGGLIRWPVIALIPIGFGVLIMQAVSELIKRIGFLTGHRDQPFSVELDKTNEEILAEEIAAEAEAQAARDLAARKT